MHESLNQAARLRRWTRAAGRVAVHAGGGLIDLWVVLSLLLVFQSYRDGIEATWNHLRVVMAMGAWWLLGVLGLGLLLAWVNALLFRLRLGEPEPGRYAPAAGQRAGVPAADERREPVLE